MKSSVFRFLLLISVCASLVTPGHVVSYAQAAHIDSEDADVLQSREDRLKRLHEISSQIRSANNQEQAPESFWKKHRKKIVAATVVFVVAAIAASTYWWLSGEKTEEKKRDQGDQNQNQNDKGDQNQKDAIRSEEAESLASSSEEPESPASVEEEQKVVLQKQKSLKGLAFEIPNEPKQGKKKPAPKKSTKLKSKVATSEAQHSGQEQGTPYSSSDVSAQRREVAMRALARLKSTRNMSPRQDGIGRVDVSAEVPSPSSDLDDTGEDESGEPCREGCWARTRRVGADAWRGMVGLPGALWNKAKAWASPRVKSSMRARAKSDPNGRSSTGVSQGVEPNEATGLQAAPKASSSGMTRARKMQFAAAAIALATNQFLGSAIREPAGSGDQLMQGQIPFAGRGATVAGNFLQAGAAYSFQPSRGDFEGPLSRGVNVSSSAGFSPASSYKPSEDCPPAAFEAPKSKPLNTSNSESPSK